MTIEDVVLKGEAKDVDFMTKLGLMKRHLLVAKELLDQKQPKQAKPQDAKIATEFSNSMQSVDTAIQAILETQRNSPEFVLKVINGLLDSANSEYGAAIANGKVSAAIEYQDSRGFVVYANELYKGIADKMAKQHPEAHKAIESSMANLTKAWPKLDHPRSHQPHPC